jgi:hypothetical protein
MKTLINLAHYKTMLDWFNEPNGHLESFLMEHQLDGIEMILYGDEVHLSHHLIQGLHLRYWPYWLDLWHENHDGLMANLQSKEAVQTLYGGQTRQCLIDWYKKEFTLAVQLKTDYVVLHVCHVGLHEVYTGHYAYTDEDVIDATIELVNKVFTVDSTVKLLFENLWWPGLRFDKPHLIQRLMDGIQYKNIGLMLDISHLAIHAGNVNRPEDLMHCVESMLATLGDYKDYIYGIHLSGSIPSNAMKVLHEKQESPLTNLPLQDCFNHVLQTISSMDSHRPLNHPVAKQIVDLLKPNVLVYEILPQSKEELSDWIHSQNISVGKCWNKI